MTDLISSRSRSSGPSRRSKRETRGKTRLDYNEGEGDGNTQSPRTKEAAIEKKKKSAVKKLVSATKSTPLTTRRESGGGDTADSKAGSGRRGSSGGGSRCRPSQKDLEQLVVFVREVGVAAHGILGEKEY